MNWSLKSVFAWTAVFGLILLFEVEKYRYASRFLYMQAADRGFEYNFERYTILAFSILSAIAATIVICVAHRILVKMQQSPPFTGEWLFFISAFLFLLHAGLSYLFGFKNMVAESPSSQTEFAILRFCSLSILVGASYSELKQSRTNGFVLFLALAVISAFEMLTPFLFPNVDSGTPQLIIIFATRIAAISYLVHELAVYGNRSTLSLVGLLMFIVGLL